MKIYIINFILFIMKLKRLFKELEMIFNQEIEELKSIIIKKFKIYNLEFKFT